MNAVLEKNQRPTGTNVPYCRNQYEHIEYTPNPEPEYRDLPPTQDGAFDYLVAMTEDAQYESLFTTMQYEPNYTPKSGQRSRQGGVALYHKVKTNPQDFVGQLSGIEYLYLR